MKMHCFLLFMMLLLSGIAAKAQTVYDKYTDFNMAVAQNHTNEAMKLGIDILSSTEKLPEKSQVKFYAFMAKLYEDGKEADKAILYYNKVLTAAPDYSVAHRALGYLYLNKANTMSIIINQNVSNKTAYNQAVTAYTALIKQALPHLEKDEACNPDADELAQIKRLYGKINDKTGLSTLDARLKQLSGKCVDLLTD